MPIAAMILGAMLIDLAFRGTEHQFAKQLQGDFGGGSQFYSWSAAIVILGALGYVKGLERASTLLLALVIIVLALRHGGAFDQIAALVVHPPAAAPSVALPAEGAASGGGGQSAGDNTANQAISAAATAAKVALSFVG